MPATSPTESKSNPMPTITRDASYRELNTMGIGGRAACLAVWDSPADLQELLSPGMASTLPAPVVQIGEGSNILFPDGHFGGTIMLSAFKATETVASDSLGVTFRVGAGRRLDDFIAETASQGFWGLENLSHIPGTAGAAAVQNVGAYGVEFADCLEAVTCYDITAGGFVTLAPTELGYGYRDSAFKHEPLRRRMIIVSVDIRLSREPKPHLGYGNLRSDLEGKALTPAAIREAIIATRRTKLPEVGVTGSSGSFFKNPVIPADSLASVRAKAAAAGIDTAEMPVYTLADRPGCVKLSAAWLIDRGGWKGATFGSTGTWRTQPLVIVNLDGHATAAEVARLAEMISDDIREKFGVELTREVEYIH